MSVNNLRNHHGSSLIEVCLSLFLFQLVFCLGLPVLYLSFAHMWIHFQSQEALICLAERQQIPVCETQLRSRIRGELPWGQLSTAHLRIDGDQAESLVEFTLTNRLKFKIQKRMPLLPGV